MTQWTIMTYFHNLLAYLAEQMIHLNQQKQIELKGFLRWLELQLGAAVADLTGKSSLQNYLGDYQKGEPHLALPDLLALLGKNRRKLTGQPDAPRLQSLPWSKNSRPAWPTSCLSSSGWRPPTR